ncbi:peptidase family C78-domain-containing protein [Xylaria intraflava]|nr:peptidase family C78-domain-containing protein [Xylaria intraflava]
MHSENYALACPLCGYKTAEEYAILLHMEELHPEGKSPFVADPDPNPHAARVGHNDTQAPKQATGNNNGDDEPFVQCPVKGCFERISLRELEDHIDLHAIEDNGGSTPEKFASNYDDNDGEMFIECPIEGCFEKISLAMLEGHMDLHAIEENDRSTHDNITAADAAPHNVSSTANRTEYRSPYSLPKDVARSTRENEISQAASDKTHQGTIDAWKKIFGWKDPSPDSNSTGGKFRLGKSELGKHAYESQMPESLVALLEKGKYTSSEGIVPVLARLLEHSPATEYAYLCHPAVHHISKLRGEGGFCGYRNIQMLSSYIVGTEPESAAKLGGGIPSIFQIQDYIENAWDMNINASGRIETGGIRGTRKYIGTPEAQAMFNSLKIPCNVEGFKLKAKGAAEAALFASVQQYFESASFSRKDKVRRTDLPPIYYQHRGHSLTIVGLERRVSGSLKLLVFDPMFHDPRGITRLVGSTKEDHHRTRAPLPWNHDSLLNLYRRGNKYLRKYYEFELLKPPQYENTDLLTLSAPPID